MKDISIKEIKAGLADIANNRIYKVRFISPSDIADKIEAQIDITMWNLIHIVVKIWDFPKWIYRIYHRAKYGYNDQDMWCTPDYLAAIIPKMIEPLKDRNPYDISRREWKNIIEDIQYTFNTVREIFEDDKIYISTNTENWKEEYEKQLAFSNRCKENYPHEESKYLWHVMSWEECKRYERGWYCFQKYYFYLYD